MTTKLDIDNFLIEKVEWRGKKIQRWERFRDFSNATIRDEIQAEEAYSHCIMKLYEVLPNPLSESYCYAIIKNFLWLGNAENRYRKKHTLTETFNHRCSNVMEISDLLDEAHNETYSMDFDTFYGQELWKEGKYTDEEIHRLELLRVVAQRLPLWARELWNLTYIQGKTYREIAVLKKIPLGSVSSKQKELKELIAEKLSGLKGNERIY